MTYWSFRGYPQWWKFSLSNDHTQFNMTFRSGGFRKLGEYTLLEVGGRWDRKGITLHDDNYLEVIVPDEWRITEWFTKMDEASAAALREYIENIPATHYDDHHNFNGNGHNNNNDDPNSLTDFEYNPPEERVNALNDPNAANADPTNAFNNTANDPIVGGSRRRRKTHRHKNKKGTRRWRK